MCEVAKIICGCGAEVSVEVTWGNIGRLTVCTCNRRWMLDWEDGQNAWLTEVQLPHWWKPERPEHRENPLLLACAKADMTAEQALDQLAKAYAGLDRSFSDALCALRSPVRFTIPADGFTITGPVDLPKGKP